MRRGPGCRVTSGSRKGLDMKRRIINQAYCAVLFAALLSVEAQQAKVYRVGVIHQGGPYKAVVDGLRDGLRQLGYEEGKQILLEIRDTKSDLKLVEEAARTFERERVNLIYAVTTSVATPVKNVTSKSRLFFPSAATRSPADSCRALGNLGGDSQVFSTRPRISRGSGSRS